MGAVDGAVGTLNSPLLKPETTETACLVLQAVVVPHLGARQTCALFARRPLQKAHSPRVAKA